MVKADTGYRQVAPRIFAVIVSYNGSKWIRGCIESVLKSSIDVSIIVVDNQSEDDTCSIIEEHFPDVDLIRSDKNLGFGQGNNLGIAKALQRSADYIFLLNQDTTIDTDSIELLVDAFRVSAGYGILSPYHMNESHNGLQYNFGKYITVDSCPELFNAQMVNNRESSVYPIDFVNAAAWLISRECILKVGGFDPLFYHYAEDEDFAQRASIHGFKLGIVPDSRIMHANPGITWEQIKYNTSFLKLTVLLKLKDLKSSGRSNALKFVKHSLDTITSNLLFRKWKELRINLNLLIFGLGSLAKVKRSRRLSQKPGAFLDL